jgi:hypothetical protein
MSGEVPQRMERWAEEVEEEVMGVAVLRTYDIEVLGMHDDKTIRELRLIRREGWYAKAFVVEFWGNKLVVKWYETPDAGTGFRTKAVLGYYDSFEEIPWFVQLDELKDFVNAEGVKKAYYLILDYLKIVFSMPFEEVK